MMLGTEKVSGIPAMLYKIRFDKYTWNGRIKSTPSLGDFLIAFHKDYPQYGRAVIATNGKLHKLSENIFICDPNKNLWWVLI